MLDRRTILSLQPRFFSGTNYTSLESHLFIASIYPVGYCTRLEMALEASAMSWLSAQPNADIISYQEYD